MAHSARPSMRRRGFGQTAGGTHRHRDKSRAPHAPITSASFHRESTSSGFSAPTLSLGSWSHSLIIDLIADVYERYEFNLEGQLQGLNHARCSAAAVDKLNLLIWNFHWNKAAIILKWNTFVMSGGQQSNGRKWTALGQSHSGWLHYNKSKKL